MVYIDDVIDAYVLAASRFNAPDMTPHEMYSVSSGRLLTLKSVVGTFFRIRGARGPAAWGARPYRQREVMVPWNTRPILPGWQPRVSLEVGIARVTNAKRQGGEEIVATNGTHTTEGQRLHPDT